jgi:UDP-N-acetylglucosamine 4,6-dehydratase
MEFVNGSERVLITGGTGSLGQVLTARCLEAGAKVRIFARDEKKQYDMSREFPDAEYVLGDIRDAAVVRDVVRDVDVVIHGASLKYVNISEIQPTEYVKTNVLGTINLMDAIVAEGGIRRAVGISSDKACLPVNAYGMTKALLEKLMLEGSRRMGEDHDTVFTVARYGNVLGTRGSVVPFWRERVANGLTVPVTNPEMTRFFFTIQEATDLIDLCLMSDNGLIVSKRMNACTLADLAEVMRGDSSVEVVGERPGEKHHEQLLSYDEMSRTTQQGDFFLYAPDVPMFQDGQEFTSENAPRLSQAEISELLDRSEL